MIIIFFLLFLSILYILYVVFVGHVYIFCLSIVFFHIHCKCSVKIIGKKGPIRVCTVC